MRQSAPFSLLCLAALPAKLCPYHPGYFGTLVSQSLVQLRGAIDTVPYYTPASLGEANRKRHEDADFADHETTYLPPPALLDLLIFTLEKK